jgi:DNA-binding phage protein
MTNVIGVAMKGKASVSHDDAMVRRLRKNPKFAAEYLKAASEDEDERRVLLIALRHLAQAQGIAKVAKAAGIERESPAYQRLLEIAARVDAEEGIRQGLVDAKKGKIRPAEECFDEFETGHGLLR